MFVAIVSAFHVLASHLTVAAAWFNLYLERRAVYENRPELYVYLKRSALGLLVFAYVFGAMAGVGIWQTTTAANPRGISTLIHNFVLYWGSEWYMFLIDVVGIIAYYYTFERVSPRTHLRLAWILALGGTGTLSIIVGILSFKLTPGLWFTTGESLNGFFNPTFWPQLFMRFALMFTITAAWALLIVTGLPKGYFARERIIRAAAVMGLGGLVVALGIWFFWYYPALPDHAKVILRSPAIPPITFTVITGGLIATFLGLLFALVMPKRQHQIVALGAMLVLFAAIFGAERSREVIRKPDIIAGYMSSNQLVFNDIPARGIRREEQQLNETGMLGSLPFLPRSEMISVGATVGLPDHQIAMGRVLVIQQCAACHNVSNQTAITVFRLALRSLAQLLERRKMTTAPQIETYLQGIGAFPYMHPFVGTPEERAAVALYLEYFIQQQQTPQLQAQARR
ncbi:c-type cytochrome [Chloroflexus sp.]|uniref:c-type cytochrome n=1 Tax=Chloroflexus sp. TaxID=1904827 RepID=UPI00404B97D2